VGGEDAQLGEAVLVEVKRCEAVIFAFVLDNVLFAPEGEDAVVELGEVEITLERNDGIDLNRFWDDFSLLGFQLGWILDAKAVGEVFDEDLEEGVWLDIGTHGPPFWITILD